MAKLTAKQERFCEEYLVDLNATQAAIRAGYSEKTANRIASQNLSKLVIQEKIELLKQNLAENVEITPQTVVEEIAKIGFADISKYIKASDKIKALELLGKYLGMFTDKMELSGVDGNPIQTETTVQIYLPNNGRD